MWNPFSVGLPPSPQIPAPPHYTPSIPLRHCRPQQRTALAPRASETAFPFTSCGTGERNKV